MYAAHPHSRGENWPLCLGSDGDRGSSPLTRGKRGDRFHHRLQARLIPTHAGKTEAITAVWDGIVAHPHSRGENLEEDSGLVDFLGSSPLTRGKRCWVT